MGIIGLIIFYPIYWLNFLLPKSKNIWVFGEFIGKKYSDNPSYLYEFVNKNKTNIRPIWLTIDKVIYNYLKERNLEVYYTYSLKGFYFSSIAKIKIVSASPSDVNRFTNSNSIIINLWHGIPLKKIGNDYNLRKENYFKNSFTWKMLSYLIPYLKEKYTYVIATSDKVAQTMQSALLIREDSIFISGLPRTDILKEVAEVSKSNEKIVFYLPTFRDNYQLNYFESLNIEKFKKLLNKYNIVFYYKLHPLDKEVSLIESERIVRLSANEDLYKLLGKTDILITDYSSVYFDFLLINRPIIFSPFDLERYLKVRELYYDYDAVTPGKKCYNWDMIMEEIKNILSGKDDYFKNRISVYKKFNKYNDFSNSERIFNWIQSL